MAFRKVKSIYFTLTISGVLSFVLFFIIAALQYPGGSSLHPDSVAYTWSENYWCDLLSSYSKNDSINYSRPYALIAMISLTLGISAYYLGISQHFFNQNWKKSVVRFSGLTSMLSSTFLFSIFHDIFVSISVLFGVIAFVLIIEELRKRKLFLEYIWGYLFVLLILLNCFIYVTKIGETHLASLQKLTFILSLSWICLTSFKFLRNESSI
jgi:hypothetical protein